MNLNELIGKRIEKITPHYDTIKRLLIASERNIIVPESAVKECIYQAEKLLQNFKNWLDTNRPELLKS